MISVAPIWLPELTQLNFRAILEAMSRPGTYQVLSLGERVIGNSAYTEAAYIALLAALLDNSVTFSDPQQLISEDELALLQANLTSIDQADFIMCKGEFPSEFSSNRSNLSHRPSPKLGTLPSPDLSATIVICIRELDYQQNDGLNVQLSGPGINGQIQCSLDGLDAEWLMARQTWVSSFPLGVDMLLVDDKQVMALPRTTKLEIL